MQLKIVPKDPCTDWMLMSNFSPSSSAGAMATKSAKGTEPSDTQPKLRHRMRADCGPLLRPGASSCAAQSPAPGTSASRSSSQRHTDGERSRCPGCHTLGDALAHGGVAWCGHMWDAGPLSQVGAEMISLMTHLAIWGLQSPPRKPCARPAHISNPRRQQHRLEGSFQALSGTLETLHPRHAQGKQLPSGLDHLSFKP